MGKKILSGNQIEVGTKVKLIKNFAGILAESEAIIIDFDLDENTIITNIDLDWDNYGLRPYVIEDTSPEMNIINFLEIID